MNNAISVENINPLLTHPADAVCGHNLQEDEIEGFSTRLYSVPAGHSARFDGDPRVGTACLFFSGQGSVHTDDEAYPVEEVTLFAPRHTHAFTVTAEERTLHLLEMTVELTEDDRREFDKCRGRYPWIMPYSRCTTYKERIKSPKTINRTLLPEHIFPRLCIGSVETSGDDQVAAHDHPMLEQLFFGLKGNQCTVKADETETAFGENDLLHIPLGSVHSVEVSAPHALHYIWIDLFKNQSGMDWITQEHETE